MKTTLTYGDTSDTYDCGADEAVRRHCAAVLYGDESRWTDSGITDAFDAYCTSIGVDGLSGIDTEER